MNNYYVYILHCADNSYYTGVTNNLERRMGQHASGQDQSCYTFKRRPLKLVFSASFHNVIDAIHSEKQIKRWSRKKKEALIAGNREALHRYSACTNETHFSNKVVVD